MMQEMIRQIQGQCRSFAEASRMSERRATSYAGKWLMMAPFMMRSRRE